MAFVSDTLEFGGAEVSMVMLAEHLPRRYEFVAVLSDAAAEETRERLAEVGVGMVEIPGLRRRPALASLAHLVRVLRGLRAEVVHVNATDQGGGLTGVLAAQILRLPTVLNVRNVIPGRSRARERVSAWAVRRADIALAPSEFVGTYLSGLGARTRVVLNGVAPPLLRPDARAALDLAEDEFVVGGIGRLHRQKAWDVLCDASERIVERVPRAACVVIGEGEERVRLESMPSCRNVRFVGYRRSAASLLGAFDVLVLPSRYEAFGRVAAEAMLAGIPVVATDVQALPEVVDQQGVLVPRDDPAALAEAVVRLAESPELRTTMIAGARARAEKLFAVERMAAETAAVYDALTRAEPGTGSTPPYRAARVV